MAGAWLNRCRPSSGWPGAAMRADLGLAAVAAVRASGGDMKHPFWRRYGDGSRAQPEPKSSASGRWHSDNTGPCASRTNTVEKHWITSTRARLDGIGQAGAAAPGGALQPGRVVGRPGGRAIVRIADARGALRVLGTHSYIPLIDYRLVVNSPAQSIAVVATSHRGARPTPASQQNASRGLPGRPFRARSVSVMLCYIL